MTDAERDYYIRRLRFPAELEKDFQEEYCNTYRRTLQIILVLFAVTVVALFSMQVLRGRPVQVAIVSYGIWWLGLIAGLLLSTRKAIHHYWQQGAMVVFALILANWFPVLVHAIVNGGGNIPPTAGPRLRVVSLCYGLMTVMAVPVVMRLQFRWVLVYETFCIGAAYFSGLRWLNVPVSNLIGDSLPGVFPLAMCLLMASFAVERQHRSAYLANYLLDLERGKSESLLGNMMPACIAARLKGVPETVADHHDEVTVLFADIADFTPFAAGKPAREVVDFLNGIFSRFDRLVEQRGLEKIKTVGDCYMVVAGVSSWRPDHLEQAARLALEMQDAVRRFSSDTGSPFYIRIGMHTGPLVAGVIGEKRFLYDVWGDTVNTASRLESHGVPGRIQVSLEVAGKLRPQFALSDRGLVEIKGKGTLKTYFLDHEIGELVQDAPVCGVP